MAKNVSPYPLIGKCIYCGADDLAAGLTDEHVIPKSLGGKHQLREATCVKCTDITKRIEGYITGSHLAVFRTAANVFTRHKKNRRTEFPQLLRTDNGLKEVMLDAKTEHPAPLSLPHFNLPGLLHEKGSAENWGDVGIGFWIKHEISTPKLPTGRVPMYHEEKLDFDLLGRVIAKIAHCEAVNFLGIDGFDPYLPDIVLGHRNDVFNLIGAIEGRYAPLEADMAWVFAAIRKQNKVLLVYCLRMFANMGFANLDKIGPPYFLAVVGELHPDKVNLFPRIFIDTGTLSIELMATLKKVKPVSNN
ncbi:HNH endonuclease [Oryzifoliimicrobium ureilyticus]|uniref:HNH endonuclease n=1 Tax=Oryzifoliimicrobium ureilyticus TaxID=3113724 RepID=UPI003076222C